MNSDALFSSTKLDSAEQLHDIHENKEREKNNTAFTQKRETLADNRAVKIQNFSLLSGRIERRLYFICQDFIFSFAHTSGRCRVRTSHQPSSTEPTHKNLINATILVKSPLLLCKEQILCNLRFTIHDISWRLQTPKRQKKKKTPSTETPV